MERTRATTNVAPSLKPHARRTDELDQVHLHIEPSCITVYTAGHERLG